MRSLLRWRFTPLLALLIIGAILALWTRPRREKPSLTFSPATTSIQPPQQSSVFLTAKTFDPSASTFSGAVEVRLLPFPLEKNPQRLLEWQARFKQVLLELAHFEDGGFKSVGESDEPIKLAPEPLFGMELRGKGDFKWAANPQVDAFYYPFDSYYLDVNPSLVPVPSTENVWIDFMQIEFNGLNFVPELDSLEANRPNDLYRIRLVRPHYLKLLVWMTGLLVAFWVVYLAGFATPKDYIGQIVALFLGIFSIRSSLLAGAPEFPCFIDFCALVAYLLASFSILLRWVLVPKAPDI